MEDVVQVPPFFLCPISLELMKDPVTVSTGITYDRDSIEKWLFSGSNNTCPATKQVILSDISNEYFLTPNITLRRLIQSWCTLNAGSGFKRIPTPKPPVNKLQIVKLLNDAKKAAATAPFQQLKCLKRLRSIASENVTNKKCIEASGAVQFLAAVVQENSTQSDDNGHLFEPNFLIDEALSVLHNLQLSESAMKSLTGKNGEFIDCLIRVMQGGSYESRAYSVLLLKSMLEVTDSMRLISLKQELFGEIVEVLRDQISQQSTKAILKLLIHVSPWGRNRIKAVEANAVSILIELLLEYSEKGRCEMVLVLLDMLCSTAEGRGEFLKHGGGLAVVSKKILRVSPLGSERAVRILLSISKFSGTPSVLQEMIQIGAVNKLFLLIQLDHINNGKIKEKAREILKLHAKVWKNFPCLPSNLLSSYPA